MTNLAMREKARRRGGSVLVEFALVFPILMLLTAGMIQMGIIFGATNAVSQVAREGGRSAGVVGLATTGTVPPLSNSTETADEHIIAIMNMAAQNANLNPSDLTYTISPAFASRPVGQPITVTVVYNLQKKVFLPFAVNAIPNNFTRKSTFMLEGASSG